ncbi:MAG TPA: alpha/beta fold hydrolase [Steroidobacteraceae bacterium]|nr:alpha/beta fold hydrolase [Steroidobacteraceae bacterium]
MKQLLTRFSALLVSVSVVAAAGPPPAKRVTFKSGGYSLVGFLYQPEGAGPWPALIWNHGSEKDPGAGRQFDTVASVFVPAGYVVFAPERRGHGESEGEYVVDQVKFTFRLQGPDEANRLTVKLLESEQLNDQLAALGYVSRLAFVDPERIVVAGCSYGGIETLLGAESRAGYKAAISISPAALSWERNEYLQARLVKAVSRINIPVLLIQPPKDASLGPAHVLGAAAVRAGTPLTVKVYPATGSSKEQGHCFGGASGMHVWADDAKAFLGKNLP